MMTIGRRTALILGAAFGFTDHARAQAPADAVHELAPSGTLRAAINFGNPVLAQRAPGTGAFGGVSVALAHELARQLGIPVQLTAFEEAGEVFKAAKAGSIDVAFLAIDPLRATEIAFTAPYALIEGCYVARADSPLHTADAVDSDGKRVAVATGSAYDLYLSRALKHAQLVRFANTEAAVAAFEHDDLDVLAGVKQPLMKLVASRPGLRLLDGRFMSIAQAMGTLQGRPAGFAFLQSFVAQAKASGFVATALKASGHGEVPVPTA